MYCKLSWVFSKKNENYTQEKLFKKGKIDDIIFRLALDCSFESLKEYGQEIEEYIRIKKQNN